MRSYRRNFPLQRIWVPGGHLRGHEPIVRFIGIRSAIGLLEQWRTSNPLDVDGIPDNEGMFSDNLQPARSAPRWWFHHLSKHLTQCCFAAHYLAVGTKELHIVGKLRHQARPV